MISYLNRLTARERKLAYATAAFAGLFLVFLVARGAWLQLTELDREIAQLESRLIDLAGQAARVAEVEAEYRRIAQEHATALSQEEIHDGLSREITRLSYQNMPVPGEALPQLGPGVARLVNISSLPGTGLAETGENIRTYRLRFRIEPVKMQNLVTFLQRVEESPLALRVDSLEITRNPTSDLVTADIEIVRTVIGGIRPQPGEDAPRAPVNLVRDGSFDEWDPAAGTFPQWTAEACAVRSDSTFATRGLASLRASTETYSTQGTVYQAHTLPAGEQFRLTLDIHVVQGAATLQVFDEDRAAPLEGAVDLTPDMLARRYEIEFRTPDGPASPRLRVPCVVLEPGTVLNLDNAVLERAQP